MSKVILVATFALLFTISASGVAEMNITYTHQTEAGMVQIPLFNNSNQLGIESYIYAHGGGLNSCGCHFNRKTGACHCHRDRGCGCTCEPARCK